MNNISIKNPLSIIAIFCTITEGLCTIVLPFIKDANQSYFIWFVMVFPLALLTSFFYTLINHHTKLYAPADFQDKDNSFASLFYSNIEQENKETIHESINTKDGAISFKNYAIEPDAPDSRKEVINLANKIFSEVDKFIPKHKLHNLWYQSVNERVYVLSLVVNPDYLKVGADRNQSFVILLMEGHDNKIEPIIAGAGLTSDDDKSEKSIANYLINKINESLI